MVPENKKATEQDVEPKKSVAEVKDELSDQDADKVAGGVKPIDY
jgi:hypothetical protein